MFSMSLAFAVILCEYCACNTVDYIVAKIYFKALDIRAEICIETDADGTSVQSLS